VVCDEALKRGLGAVKTRRATISRHQRSKCAIGVVEVAERAPGQRVAFDVVDPALLDLPVVRGCQGPTGRDEEAVVLDALAVAPLDFGIVEGGADRKRLTEE
jgi:hypothetical protein